jgi:hypothetical protein
MKVSLLDLHCLNAVADDLETVTSVLDDVRRSSHGRVDAADVAACLAELVRDGMAEACVFDPAAAAYVPAASLAQDCDRLWFRITDRGRRHLDANWVDD